MHRYFLQLSFNGSNYHGWQIQKNANTVQAEINNALSTILQKQIEIMGAGRTDAGVHSKMMMAHFDVEELLPNLTVFQHQLNSILPLDIAISAVKKVRKDGHARFDASSRTYEYLIHNKKNPFLEDRSYYLVKQLSTKLMNEASVELINHTDFTSFSKLHTETKTNNCDITSAHWKKTKDGWVFTITADRFLRNMVRAIVGTMIEVGLKKVDVATFNKIILAKDRASAGFSVPAHGLYLININYPQDIYE